MARFERFSCPPHAAHVGVGARKPTMMDRQLAMMRNMREEEDARISTEDELKRELFDFTHVIEVDEYGFPLSTRYQISDDVPDVYVPRQKDKEENQNSASQPDSVTNPAGGVE